MADGAATMLVWLVGPWNDVVENGAVMDDSRAMVEWLEGTMTQR